MEVFGVIHWVVTSEVDTSLGNFACVVKTRTVQGVNILGGRMRVFFVHPCQSGAGRRTLSISLINSIWSQVMSRPRLSVCSEIRRWISKFT